MNNVIRKTHGDVAAREKGSRSRDGRLGKQRTLSTEGKKKIERQSPWEAENSLNRKKEEDREGKQLGELSQEKKIDGRAWEAARRRKRNGGRDQTSVNVFIDCRDIENGGAQEGVRGRHPEHDEGVGRQDFGGGAPDATVEAELVARQARFCCSNSRFVKQDAAICENELDEKYWLGDLILAAEMLIEVAKSLDSEEAQQGNKSEINQKDISDTKIAGKTGMPTTHERQGQRNADTTCSDEASVKNKITSVDRNMKLNEFPDHVIPAILNTGRIMTKRSMKLHNLNSPNAGHVSIENDQVALTTHDCEEGDPLDGTIKEDAIECETMLKTPDHTLTGYSDTSVLKGNNEKIDTPSTDFCSKDEEPCKSSRLPAEVGNDRIAKYTFKRTRKRGSPDSKNKDVYLEGNKKLRKADK
ncbi:hypothetical protein ZIOFF_068657 [Zingiber officinale]|uniref:Uncharacterized protein n=1 Tax=Zingiber officinale TaxID=94328 RepID=A0A8J5CHL9_ZINOF|nr:hypothetical protein ZIOFF_068657 [Zingiber officinale]